MIEGKDIPRGMREDGEQSEMDDRYEAFEPYRVGETDSDDSKYKTQDEEA